MRICEPRSPHISYGTGRRQRAALFGYTKLYGPAPDGQAEYLAFNAEYPGDVRGLPGRSWPLQQMAIAAETGRARLT